MAVGDQRGYTFIIILIIIAIGAFFFSGGMRITTKSVLTQYEQPSVTPRPTTTIPNDSNNPNPGTVAWSVTVSQITCQNQIGKAIATVKGPQNGYALLSVVDSLGNTTPVDTEPFTSPETKISLTLENTKGFSSSPWRLSIFEGGSQNGDTWSGGTQKTSSDQQPTGCQ